MKNNVVYIGNFAYPDGNAAGKRVSANAKLLESFGYEVSFICRENTNLDNSNIITVEVDKKNIISQVKETGYLFKQIKNHIISLNKSNICAVILYGELTNSFLNLKIINWLKKEKIKVIIDCVEWWQEKDGNFIFRVIKNINTSFLMGYVNKKADGIITISKYLNDYYSHHEVNCVTIPPLVEYKYNKEYEKNRNFRVVYAGYPFRLGIKNISTSAMKDRLDLSIEVLTEVKKVISSLTFEIFGLTKEQYVLSVPKHKNLLEKNSNWINFKGNIKNSDLTKHISTADAAILLRDDNLVTRAGFSTKLVESISLGTPVITTNVGDISSYIKEGNNGIVLPLNKSTNEYSKKIVSYINCIEQKSEGIKVDYFDIFYYKNYQSCMRNFLNEIGILEIYK